MKSLDRTLELIDEIYGSAPLPRPFSLLRGIQRIHQGEDLGSVARSLRTTARHLAAIRGSADPVRSVLRISSIWSRTEESGRRARRSLGQLLLGSLAERAFETLYKRSMGTLELTLVDARDARNETDYRVLNGSGRPLFRMNIKFHGTLFRNSRDLVGLEPEDCFALATYKIHQALLKQNEELLPYMFVIVSVPGVTGDRVGAAVPDELVDLAELVHASSAAGKRDVEDRIVGWLIAQDQRPEIKRTVEGFSEQIERSDWRVVSARKADLLLREKLFNRVYAVRVRGFARNYRNAELDMHFSLTHDLTLLEEFLEILKQHGIQGLLTRLERGVV